MCGQSQAVVEQKEITLDEIKDFLRQKTGFCGSGTVFNISSRTECPVGQIGKAKFNDTFAFSPAAGGFSETYFQNAGVRESVQIPELWAGITETLSKTGKRNVSARDLLNLVETFEAIN